ncbi:MAG: hypothetical protein JWN25_1006 [Verrucomicrobiales bacterium]|nr:hypothetical protein [Verrucomicrobiales bacterium]MDB6128976.1 hypothetical protein [Verrucomicrobiales bacterium]
MITTTIRETGLSNAEFLERYSKAGRIGLAGGWTLIDKLICRAERHVDQNKEWSKWSHAFLFQGIRVDGCHWVLESDLQLKRKHILLGVQENRVSKYHDEVVYPCLAVVDFDLPSPTTQTILTEALELVANKTRYSLRELVGALISLKKQDLRQEENLLSRDKSFFCSAFVHHVFRKAGMDLAPGLSVKNTTPADLSRSPIPHTLYLLERDRPQSIRRRFKARVRGRIKALSGEELT